MDSYSLIDYTNLKKWFKEDSRDFPWRNTNDPYAVWVSEVMLQQTQASVVIPYFLNWMKLFPTIPSLAAASLDQVIKAWEGLGYYSRVRNLHEGAKFLVEYFDGMLPNNESDLKKIKGLGPYTIGAILSFAFHKKIEAVDGNVLRVITRLFALESDISKSSTLQTIRQLVFRTLPDEESWIVNEALIELGATICQRKPKCFICPLKNQCVAFQKGLTDHLPVKSNRTKISHLHRCVAVVQFDSYYLVKKGDKGKIMSDLYEFPYVEVTEGEPSIQSIANLLQTFDLKAIFKKNLNQVKHGFTRFQAHLYPFHFQAKKKIKIENYEWVEETSLKNLAFSSGHRKILHQIFSISDSH